MLNKIIIAKYLKDNDQTGFYSEMMSYIKSVNPLTPQEKSILFSDMDETLKQLDHLTNLGYFEKSSKLLNCVHYTYNLYYFYPLLFTRGNLLLPGDAYSITDVCIVPEDNLEDLKDNLHEFKKKRTIRTLSQYSRIFEDAVAYYLQEKTRIFYENKT